MTIKLSLISVLGLCGVLALGGFAMAQDRVEELPSFSPTQQAMLICQSVSLMSGQAGPAYQSGVDVYGRPVVPADGGVDDVFVIPDQVEIPINYDVVEALGVKVPAGVKAEMPYGTLSLYKGGALSFNGKDISSNVQSYCRKHYKK